MAVERADDKAAAVQIKDCGIALGLRHRCRAAAAGNRPNAACWQASHAKRRSRCRSLGIPPALAGSDASVPVQTGRQRKVTPALAGRARDFWTVKPTPVQEAVQIASETRRRRRLADQQEQ